MADNTWRRLVIMGPSIACCVLGCGILMVGRCITPVYEQQREWIHHTEQKLERIEKTIDMTQATLEKGLSDGD